MRKIILSMAIIITLFIGSIGIISADDSIFPDLKGYGWAEIYIGNMVINEGMEGYPDGKFKPGNQITVAEFIKTTVALVDGKKEKTGLHWASGYIDSALELEIVPAGMFTFLDYNKPITREKMTVIMERTAQLVLKEDKFENATTDRFIDKNKICGYCDEYIAQAISRGLINGLEANRFGPTEPANRAHAATMLSRLINADLRLTAVGDYDAIAGIIKRGDTAYDFAKGVENDMGGYYKDYDYVVFDSTNFLSITNVKEFSKPDHFGSVMSLRYDVPHHLYIFNKAGVQLERTLWFSKIKATSASFKHKLSEIEYFALINDDLKRWEFYYNDLR